jgi:molybdopterin-guanine dinucleotide biosynthesis protein B
MSSPVVPEMAKESLASMRIFGFAGWSGSGKTTLLEQIIPRLVQKGLAVSLVKHAHHRTEFDQPGKDSFRLRHAGCSEVLVTAGARWALMHELRGEPELPLAQALRRLSPCDLVLIEGYKAHPIPKLEIWRAAVGKPLLHPRDPRIVGLATDSPDDLPPGTLDRLPVFSLSDPDAIATFVAAEATPNPSAIDFN